MHELDVAALVGQVVVGGIEVSAVGGDQVLDVEHHIGERRAFLIGVAVGRDPSAESELLHVGGDVLVDHGVEHGNAVGADQGVIIQGMVFVDLCMWQVDRVRFELVDLGDTGERIVSA